MKMSKQLVEAYIKILERIKSKKEELNELKEEEKGIAKELQNYLTLTDEPGIRIDEDRIITLTHSEKKISKSSKSYKTFLKVLCLEKGLPDDKFIDAILDGKIETTFQQPKLKIVKKR